MPEDRDEVRGRFGLRRWRVYLAVSLVGLVAAAVIAGAIKSDADGNPHVVTFQTPEHIGTLTQAADQSASTKLAAALKSQRPEHSFAVTYDDTANPGQHVSAWGASDPALTLLGHETMLSRFFDTASAQLDEAVSNPVDIDLGTTIGQARCAGLDATTGSGAVCAWVDTSTVIAFLFTGRTTSDCADLVTQMMNAIIHRK
jgi:hypothetical protein